MAPRTRYAMVVTTAVVGAGVVAFGAGSALPPQQLDNATAALDKVNASRGGGSGEAADDSSVRTAAAPPRASRAQRRVGAPLPEILPEWVRPAVGPISSLYGARWGTQHKGIDIAAPYGSAVKAAAAGTVVVAGWSGGYGKLVEIQHPNGIITRYGHNSTVVVKVGQKVEAGDLIAKVGSTGYSTGAHCHFEVRKNDVAINPMPFMLDRDVNLASNVDTSR